MKQVLSRFHLYGIGNKQYKENRDEETHHFLPYLLAADPHHYPHNPGHYGDYLVHLRFDCKLLRLRKLYAPAIIRTNGRHPADVHYRPGRGYHHYDGLSALHHVRRHGRQFQQKTPRRRQNGCQMGGCDRNGRSQTRSLGDRKITQRPYAGQGHRRKYR